MSAEGRQQLVLPAKIRAYLVGIVERKWTIAERDPRPAVEALPGSLPAGEVKSVVSGGPFGWLIDARLDEIDGRLALEVLEDDRMSGPNHYRVWEDGTEEPLERDVGVDVSGGLLARGGAAHRGGVPRTQSDGSEGSQRARVPMRSRVS